jgi:cytoskeletal protein CcmA (bactofilin family)
VRIKKTASEEFNGFLSLGTSLEGDLRFSGTLHLNGNVRGSITTTDVLIIGEHATVEADIKAGDLQIYGTVIGSVDCAGRVEICESGRLRGEVRTPSLVIKEGGVFEGTSRAAAPAETPKENIWDSSDKGPELTQLSTS